MWEGSPAATPRAEPAFAPQLVRGPYVQPLRQEADPQMEISSAQQVRLARYGVRQAAEEEKGMVKTPSAPAAPSGAAASSDTSGSSSSASQAQDWVDKQNGVRQALHELRSMLQEQMLQGKGGPVHAPKGVGREELGGRGGGGGGGGAGEREGGGGAKTQ